LPSRKDFKRKEARMLLSVTKGKRKSFLPGKKGNSSTSVPLTGSKKSGKEYIHPSPEKEGNQVGLSAGR